MIETRVVDGLPLAAETGAEETAADTNAEEPAFEALYRTHAKRIYSLAYRFTGNAADAAGHLPAGVSEARQLPAGSGVVDLVAPARGQPLSGSFAEPRGPTGCEDGIAG